jgi:AbrB family looped-hinge helix DNA binding protein
MIPRDQTADIRIGKRAQLVIPVALRRKMGIDEGDILHARVTDEGSLILTPAPRDPVERLRQIAHRYFKGVDPVAFQREMRDEDEA